MDGSDTRQRVISPGGCVSVQQIHNVIFDLSNLFASFCFTSDLILYIADRVLVNCFVRKPTYEYLVYTVEGAKHSTQQVVDFTRSFYSDAYTELYACYPDNQLNDFYFELCYGVKYGMIEVQHFVNQYQSPDINCSNLETPKFEKAMVRLHTYPEKMNHYIHLVDVFLRDALSISSAR